MKNLISSIILKRDVEPKTEFKYTNLKTKMEEKTKIQLSSQLFGGYFLYLPLIIINDMTKENIVDYITDNLYSLLKSNNLEELLLLSKQANWHIHDDLIKSDGIIYVCGCNFFYKI